MKNEGLWRMFCETGDPVCYLVYRKSAKQRQRHSDFPQADTLAFSGTGNSPEIRV